MAAAMDGTVDVQAPEGPTKFDESHATSFQVLPFFSLSSYIRKNVGIYSVYLRPRIFNESLQSPQTNERNFNGKSQRNIYRQTPTRSARVSGLYNF